VFNYYEVHAMNNKCHSLITDIYRISHLNWQFAAAHPRLRLLSTDLGVETGDQRLHPSSGFLCRHCSADDELSADDRHTRSSPQNNDPIQLLTTSNKTGRSTPCLHYHHDSRAPEISATGACVAHNNANLHNDVRAPPTPVTSGLAVVTGVGGALTSLCKLAEIIHSHLACLFTSPSPVFLWVAAAVC